MAFEILTYQCSQTTIPAVIHDALHLKLGEYIHYTLLAGGKVIMSRQDED
ncbi:type II toxin-antitoxin system PrlF family antitoxin [Escherichia coli]